MERLREGIPSIQIKLHKHQKRAEKSKARFIALISGIQGGKTTYGVKWIWDRYRNDPGDYLIAAPTYKILQQSTLKRFFELIPSDWGEYKKQDSVFLPRWGGTFYIRSTEDPDAIEGMTVKAVWLDEAGKMKLKAWVNAQGRVSTTKGPILITTTPYALNWLYREFYKRWQEGDLDYDVIQFASVENPAFPKEEFERAKRTLDPRIFDMRYRGLFRKMTGLVYPDFDQDNIAELPERKEVSFYAGVDWGYNNPACILTIAEDKDYNWWVVEEIYKSGLRIGDLVKQAKKLHQKYNIQAFYCDPSEPANIEEFRAAGLDAFPADNEIAPGIEIVAEAIRTKRLKVSRRCVNFLEEMETYHYPEPKEGKEAKEEPEKVDDHAMDAVRYFAISRHKKGPNIWIIG